MNELSPWMVYIKSMLSSVYTFWWIVVKNLNTVNPFLAVHVSFCGTAKFDTALNKTKLLDMLSLYAW